MIPAKKWHYQCSSCMRCGLSSSRFFCHTIIYIASLVFSDFILSYKLLNAYSFKAFVIINIAMKSNSQLGISCIYKTICLLLLLSLVVVCVFAELKSCSATIEYIKFKHCVSTFSFSQNAVHTCRIHTVLQ